MKNALVSIVFALLLLIVTACAAPSTPIPPTAPPFTLPTLLPASPTPIPTALPTPTQLPPTATIPPTNTAEATQAAALPTVAQPPTPTSTPTPAPSPTPAIAAGLYVTSLRIDPDPPVRGPDLKFIPTFLNSLGRLQNYRWVVYIARIENPNRSIGETTRTDTPIGEGTVEVPSFGSWKLPLGGGCESYIAQIGWFNEENKVVFFKTPTGQVFQKSFVVCPP